MTLDTAQRRAEASLFLNSLNGYDGACIGDIAQEKDIDRLLAYKQQARREALEEAVRVARANTYMGKEASDGGNFGGPASCEYGCGGVIADAIDRLREGR